MPGSASRTSRWVLLTKEGSTLLLDPTYNQFKPTKSKGLETRILSGLHVQEAKPGYSKVKSRIQLQLITSIQPSVKPRGDVLAMSSSVNKTKSNLIRGITTPTNLLVFH